MAPSHPLAVRGLRKAFKHRAVLQGVDLSLRPRALSVIVGRSGSGKSTLLRCLNGLETPDAGSIDIAGQRLDFPADAHDEAKDHAVRSKVGMVFQHFDLFPHLDVLENLTLAPRVVRGRDAAAEALALLEKVGLGSHRAHFPSQLSGGQQQRAAIARALAMRPEVLLFDEPTSALDPHLAKEVLDVMLGLKKEGMTQVLVTHELAFARRYGDWVVFLEDGVVVEQGRPSQVFGRPKDLRTKRYLAGAKA